MTRSPTTSHLSEDELIAAARQRDGCRPAHLQACALCRSRLALACDLLRVDGLDAGHAAADRAAALIRRLDAARAADRSPARVVVRGRHPGEIAVDAEGAEVFVRSAALGLRRGPEPASSSLGCRRRFGEYEVEVGVVLSPGDRLGLVDLDVRLHGPSTRRPSATLATGDRELAVRPLAGGRATFREVSPGDYAIFVTDRRVVVGRLLITLLTDGGSEPAEESS